MQVQSRLSSGMPCYQPIQNEGLSDLTSCGPTQGLRGLIRTAIVRDTMWHNLFSPVGSDCLAHGSSKTASPSISGWPSGRSTCRTSRMADPLLNTKTTSQTGNNNGSLGKVRAPGKWQADLNTCLQCCVWTCMCFHGASLTRQKADDKQAGSQQQQTPCKLSSLLPGPVKLEHTVFHDALHQQYRTIIILGSGKWVRRRML